METPRGTTKRVRSTPKLARGIPWRPLVGPRNVCGVLRNWPVSVGRGLARGRGRKRGCGCGRGRGRGRR
eukprot:7921639-Pyramimonas_sp.AAC.1